MSVVPRVRNSGSNRIHTKVDSIPPGMKITQMDPVTSNSSDHPWLLELLRTKLAHMTITAPCPAFSSVSPLTSSLPTTHICTIPCDLMMSQGLCKVPLLEWPPFQVCLWNASTLKKKKKNTLWVVLMSMGIPSGVTKCFETTEVVVAQWCKYTRCHWVVCFKTVMWLSPQFLKKERRQMAFPLFSFVFPYQST